jgi:hypothetical protein
MKLSVEEFLAIMDAKDDEVIRMRHDLELANKRIVELIEEVDLLKTSLILAGDNNG